MSARQRASQTATKSEVFAMRLDPQLKYLAELAARRERRSLANYFEWAIEEVLKNAVLREAQAGGEKLIAGTAGSVLWDQREADRVCKLARECPDLLSYEEQNYVRVIAEFALPGKSGKPELAFKRGATVDLPVVRACWDEIKAHALGKGSEEDLAKRIQEYHKNRKKLLLTT